MNKTGWSPPPLAQDDHYPLFRWFANRPGARRLVREAAREIAAANPEKRRGPAPDGDQPARGRPPKAVRPPDQPV